jgi:hypothetical protein
VVGGNGHQDCSKIAGQLAAPAIGGLLGCLLAFSTPCNRAAASVWAMMSVMSWMKRCVTRPCLFSTGTLRVYSSAPQTGQDCRGQTDRRVAETLV